jgi:hypothetical protein
VIRINVFSASIGRRFCPGSENYGDNLMGILLPELFNVDPKYVRPERAELIGAGSILDAYHRRVAKKLKKGRLPILKQRPWRTLHVWGSGFMNTFGLAVWPQSIHIHAVRGPLSLAKVVGDAKYDAYNKADIAMGDPAILLPLLKPKTGPSKIAVAVIPHFASYPEFVRRYGSSMPPHWEIINLLDDPVRITEQISSAECVISSSLHGLIVADAYNIPSRRMVATGIKGDGFKFRDYEAFRGQNYSSAAAFEEYLSVGQKVHDRMDLPCPPAEGIVHRLIAAFPK